MGPLRTDRPAGAWVTLMYDGLPNPLRNPRTDGLGSLSYSGYAKTGLALTVLAWAWCSTLLADTHVLLVATAPDHPWGTHMYQFECGVLAKCLENNEGVTATVIMNWPPDPDTVPLDQLDAIVFYSRPIGEIVLSPEHREQFRNLMQRGVGLTAIHWSTGVGYSKLADHEPLRREFQAVLGGWFRRPPCGIKTAMSRLKQLDPEHAICRGWEEYVIRDEFYLNPQLHRQTVPLLQVEVDGVDQTVAWTYIRSEPAEGRSFGVTLGHFHDNFARPAFRRALINGILWTARHAVPDGGAQVDVERTDLELPEPVTQ